MGMNQLSNQDSQTANLQKFTSSTIPLPQTNPVVLDIMGIINHHAINNGNVEA